MPPDREYPNLINAFPLGDPFYNLQMPNMWGIKGAPKEGDIFFLRHTFLLV